MCQKYSASKGFDSFVGIAPCLLVNSYILFGRYHFLEDITFWKISLFGRYHFLEDITSSTFTNLPVDAALYLRKFKPRQNLFQTISRH